MSIQSEIDRISTNVSNTYSVLSEAGADTPPEQNTDNLAATAASIKAVLYTAQTLTSAQMTQARKNIGAASQTAVEQANYIGLLSTHMAVIAAGDGVLPIDYAGNLVKANNKEMVLDLMLKVSDKTPTLNDLKKGYAVAFSAPITNAEGAFNSFEPLSTGEYNYSLDADAFNASVSSDIIPGCIVFGLGACYDAGLPSGMIVPAGGADFDGIALDAGTYLTLYASAFRITGFDWSEDEDAPVYSDTLTWDGNSDGRIVVSIPTGVGTDTFDYCRVHEDVPADCTAGGSITLWTVDGSQTATVEANSETITDDVIVFGDYVFFAPIDNANYQGYTFPKKGTYFLQLYDDGILAAYVTSVAVTGYQYLISGQDSTATKYVAELTWNGDTTGREVVQVASNVGLCHMSSSVPTESDLANGGTFTVIITTDSGEEPTTKTFESATFENGFGVVGGVYIIPSDGFVYGGITFPKAGIYFFYDDNEFISSFTITGYQFAIEVEGEGEYATKDYVDQAIASAMILTSPNGTKYKITVADDGTLSATAVTA